MTLSIKTKGVVSQQTSSIATLKQKTVLDDTKTYLYLSSKNIPLKRFDIYNSQTESVTLQKGKGTIYISMSVMNDFIEGKLRLNASNLLIDTKGMKGKGPLSLQTLAANTIEDIKKTSLTVLLKGKKEAYTLKISTPFDKLFASKINTLMKKKIKEQKEKVKEIISQEITKQNTALSSLINDQKMALGEPLLKQFKESSSLQTLLDNQNEAAKNKLDEEMKKIQEKASNEIKGSLMKELKKLPF
tara:strand:- start:1892 stop:2623 length:732 start_codon:yes stop_codon:yes gene_type:complete